MSTPSAIPAVIALLWGSPTDGFTPYSPGKLIVNGVNLDANIPEQEVASCVACYVTPNQLLISTTAYNSANWTTDNMALRAQQGAQYVPTPKPAIPLLWVIETLQNPAVNADGSLVDPTIWANCTQTGVPAGDPPADLAPLASKFDVGVAWLGCTGIWCAPADDTNPVGATETVQAGQSPFPAGGVVPVGTVLRKTQVYMGQAWEAVTTS